MRLKFRNSKKSNYWSLLYELGVLNRVACTAEESDRFRATPVKDIPEDVCYSMSELGDNVGDHVRSFWRYTNVDITEEEMQTIILAQSALHLKSIKSGIIFLAVLAAIGLFGVLIAFLPMLF